MIHILTLIAALPAAFLRGGRLANASTVRLRSAWVILAALGVQATVVYLPQLQDGGRYQLPATLIVLSYLMLLAGVIANHRIKGMKLIGLGILLNFVVIVANGGFMPIAPAAADHLGLLPQGMEYESGMRVIRSKDIVLEADKTVFWVLSDVFVTGLYIPLKSVFSLGDAISAVGLFMAIQAAMLPDRRIGQRQPTGAASGVS